MNGNPVPITLCVGATGFSSETTDLDELRDVLRRADPALYEAQKQA